MNIEEEINKINERNRKVEIDKAREISWARRLIILVLTYVLLSFTFYFMNSPRPWLNSLVPTIAFVLSTLSMPYFKKVWLKKLSK